jgi:hypothetical protein
VSALAPLQDLSVVDEVQHARSLSGVLRVLPPTCVTASPTVSQPFP